MGAGCYSTQVGLTSGHAYSLIGAYVVNGKKMVKMRNPWSSEGYTGPYSDKAAFWNTVSDAEKARVGYKNANDG